MTDIIRGRQTVENDDSIVVFLIGARINRWWLLPLALPILSKMQKMLAELVADPDSGLIGYQPLGLGGTVQYWRSIDHLLEYADRNDRTHAPTGRAFYKKLFKNEAVGIWHECFLVEAGRYECFYANMPRFGLGKHVGLVPAKGPRRTSRGRLGLAEPGEAAA